MELGESHDSAASTSGSLPEYPASEALGSHLMPDCFHLL